MTQQEFIFEITAACGTCAPQSFKDEVEKVAHRAYDPLLADDDFHQIESARRAAVARAEEMFRLADRVENLLKVLADQTYDELRVDVDLSHIERTREKAVARGEEWFFLAERLEKLRSISSCDSR